MLQVLQLKKRIQTILDSLGPARFSDVLPVEGIHIREGDYTFSETYRKPSGTSRIFQAGETWGGTDRHFWFSAGISIPERYRDMPVMVRLTTGATDIWNTDNPQILVYVDGKLSATMDMNHTDLFLSERAVPGSSFTLDFYAYSNSSGHTNFFDLRTCVFHPEVDELYYDMKVLFEASCLLHDDELDAIHAVSVLNECINLLDLRCTGSQEFYRSVRVADSFLRERYYKTKNSPAPVTVHSTGHTHIDVAWKWPLRQTRQKAVRSFLTVLNLMDRYPEYRFMSSQPQLYQFVKDLAPSLYDRIKQRIREGRWEAEGAMWLEPDCNLTSGESLIRQILYGKKFFREEFGIDKQEVLWLPDVFGYSVALPQILKKSGIRYFMTTKLGWNEYNKIPNDTMLWKGIDGTEILTYFITTTNYEVYPDRNPVRSFNTTYNGMQNANQVKGTWQRYQNKNLSQDVLTCFGYGDGGGGPTSGMLEESRRLEYGLCGCPAVKQTSVRDFFHILEKNLQGKNIPEWTGELYLEFHRGTYTSVAKNKKNNRLAEFRTEDAEFFSVLALSLGKGFLYPSEELDKIWHTVLLNQFHDILPGSSIHDVYDDSDRQYARVFEGDDTIIAAAQRNILGHLAETGSAESLAVFNQLSFPRTGIVQLEKQSAAVSGLVSQTTSDGNVLCLVSDVVPKGMQIISGGSKVPGETPCVIINQEHTGDLLRIETKFYRIEFNRTGELLSVYDRTAGREVLMQGTAGNRLQVFEDRPEKFDAWNIDAWYTEKSWVVDDTEACSVVENGPVRAVIFIRKKFLSSVIEQSVCFYNHTKRIDFSTFVDWKEHQLLLKTFFPVDVLSTKAVYEVQFGNIERPTHQNTSWDQAKFEVCAHKWADLSECGYGVALLNDCKYGYSIRDSVMSLTLLKSGIFPDPDADIGIHRFTYALYPHEGDFRTGGVIREAYDLNCPLYGTTVRGAAAGSSSLLSVSSENVIAETVKQAEESADIVIRLYESWGKRTKTQINLPLYRAGTLWECDCMESPVTELPLKDGTAELLMKPYEIKTLRIRPSAGKK